jgi:hypothetical protein
MEYCIYDAYTIPFQIPSDRISFQQTVVCLYFKMITWNTIVLYPQVGQSFSDLANAIKSFHPSVGNMLITAIVDNIGDQHGN